MVDLKVESERCPENGVWSYADWLHAYKAVKEEVQEEFAETAGWSFNDWLLEYTAAQQQAWAFNTWVSESQEGKPQAVTQAAYCPDIRSTPEARMLEVPEHTPCKLPLPTAKTQLVAAKKMESKLKQQAAQEAKKASNGKGDAKSLDKASKTPTPPKKDPKTHSKTEKGNGKAKNPDRNNQGPVIQAYKAFMEAQKKKNVPHAEALQLWKESKERAKILQGMSESERKRRRF